MSATFKTIDGYISSFPKGTQEILEQVRRTIKKTAPNAEETISYGIPTFKLNSIYLVYFAAFKNHIGFYATPTGHDAFKEALSKYKQGKGSVQFPLDKPMPLKLIAEIVKFRINENELKARKKESNSNQQTVQDFLKELQHPFKKEIVHLRKIILAANKNLTENIKWNGPNFCLDAEDRITMRIYPPKQIQLIFHRGAKLLTQPKGKLIKDDSGILVWKTNDRAVASFANMEEIKLQASLLTKIINSWLDAAKNN
jgi:uncharacterized protein YdhG (YjbR/CyaY superfamily)